MRHVMAVLSTLSLSLPPVLHAQLPITTGQRVRITSIRNDVHAEVGTVLSTSGDSVVVLVKGVRTEHYRQVYRVDTIALPITAIDRLEVSKRGPSATKRGMRTGAIVGTLGGFMIGIASYQECKPAGDFIAGLNCIAYPSQIEYGAGMSLVGAAIGAGIGAFIGSTRHEVRWLEVPINHVSLSELKFHPGGASIGLTIAF